MGKAIFIPTSIVAGFAAGFAAKKLTDFIWGRIDDQAPPEPEDRDVTWPKLIAAMAIQGAVLRVMRGATEHALRQRFERSTGVWPGETRPEDK